MKINNKVSIITPVYNAERFLSINLDSVIGQTYTDWEHLLVDDVSTDNSRNIIETYERLDERIKYIRLKKNSGAGVARNTAIKHSRGRYIAFLDSDDFWHKDKLKKQVAFMKNKNISFSYCNYFIVKGDSKSIVSKIVAPSKVNYNTMLKNDYIGCLTVVYDTFSLGKVYMPDIRKRQDWVLWLKLLKKTNYAFCLPEALAYYRVGNESLSNNKFKLLKHNFNVYHEQLKMSYLKSTFMMFRFLIHYFVFKITSKKKP